MKARLLLISISLSMLLSITSAFFPQQASAATIRYWLQYQSWRDEYRIDFTYPYGTASYKLWFISTTNRYYEINIPVPPTKVFYLTCNGTYYFDFYDSAGNLIGYFDNIVTTQIKVPACQSYPEQTGRNDLNLQYTPVSPDQSLVTWTNPGQGPVTYEIYHDGQLYDTTTDTSATLPNGQITIVAKDPQGNTIGQSDAFIPEYSDSSPSNGSGTGDDQTGGEVPPPDDRPVPPACNVCDKIRDALECPEWDAYMGELTRAIRNALPTLPEWRQIAEQFVDAFDEYFGPVPSFPTRQEIENAIRPPLPSIDITEPPEAQIEPVVPDEFNQPFDYDITTGPEIEIEDESEPFEIYEPDEFLNADDPGVFVYPNDPRNSSGGIKNPDTITTPYERPEPTNPAPGHPGDPEIPPSEMPMPSGTTGTIPTPGETDTNIPIPSI